MLLKKHTLAQAICGALQGFFLTVIEVYLFMNVLNVPINGLISLELAVLYILAIVSTPVLLGLLSYSNLKNTKVTFYLFEIIFLALFLIFSPVSVVIIYIIVSITSILISYFAGDDFIWYKVLNSTSINDN